MWARKRRKDDGGSKGHGGTMGGVREAGWALETADAGCVSLSLVTA